MLQVTTKNLTKWTEFQLLGPKVYSSSLKFQAHIVIQIIQSNKFESIRLINKIQDNKQMMVDLTLFGFILRELLLVLLNSCSVADELVVSSETQGANVVICIADIKDQGFKKVIENCLSRRAQMLQKFPSDVEITLKLCYHILSFYGGNLWSECSNQGSLKLYFSIPEIKIGNC